MRVSLSTLVPLTALASALLVTSACSNDSPLGPDATTGSIVPPRSPTGVTSTTGPITNRVTGKCIDVAGGSTEPGTPVAIAPCHGETNQQFTWQPDSTIHVYGTMCLDASPGTGQDGDQLIIWSCQGGPNQRWTTTGAGEIRGINGKCLDLVGANQADGTRLMIWNCYQAASQKWDNASASGTVPDQVLPGVTVGPGKSIQNAVNANPAGTKFLIKAGTYLRQTVIPKAGNIFQGEPGTVMDGQGATAVAFQGRSSSGWVNGVTIRGLKITGYVPPVQYGAISAGNAPGDATSGWVVDSCEVSYNKQYGIRIGDNMRVANSNLHHNDMLNISGGGDNTIVENTEIAYGNYLLANDPGFEAGGTKFVLTRNLILRNNYVHDNGGPGLWTDTDNIDALIEGNRVENNMSEGIVHEISYGAIIRNNTVKNNGWNDPHQRGWLWNAAIAVHSSPDVEIYGNTVTDNFNGVVAIQQNRGSGRYGAYVVQNLYVHDNVITQTNTPPAGFASAASGMVQDVGDDAIFTSRNNRFANNEYFLGTNQNPFEWLGAWRTESAWKGLGQDATGTFHR